MSIAGIEGIGDGGFKPFVAPQINPTDNVVAPVAPAGTEAAGGPSFSDMLVDGLDRLEGVQRKADDLAVQAATGKLENIHDYTTAATEAAVTTQMTVAVQNKAIAAFTEIMRMHVG